MRKALITGITGQDGSYLAELLLTKGYEVHGLVRRVAADSLDHRYWRIRHLLGKIHLHCATLENYASILQLISSLKPDDCYHLAAQSYIGYSFEDEFSTFESNFGGTHYLLSAIKTYAPKCRVYFAGSSEMFGKVSVAPQNECTPFHPRSAYGISKVAGFHLTRNYREAYDLHASCGILFNHESPRRGFEFVTRKISSHVAMIKLGKARQITMGNLDAKRDWGHAREYTEAMWLMLQSEVPDHFVIATGETHSVRDFLDTAFSCVGYDYREFVRISPELIRPTDVDLLLGDSTKAEKTFGWKAKVRFHDLVAEMVDSDLRAIKG